TSGRHPRTARAFHSLQKPPLLPKIFSANWIKSEPRWGRYDSFLRLVPPNRDLQLRAIAGEYSQTARRVIRRPPAPRHSLKTCRTSLFPRSRYELPGRSAQNAAQLPLTEPDRRGENRI